MEFKVSWANEPSADDSWLPWSAVKDTTLFDTYCLQHQLYSLRVSAAVSRQQAATLNRLPIDNVALDSLIYVPLRQWSPDNTWFDALALPHMTTHSYVVLGLVQRFNAARTKITVMFPVFQEVYSNVSHAEFAAYGHSVLLAPTDIVVSADLILQFPQITNPDTNVP